MREVSTSPGPARAATRAPMCIVTPARSVPRTSHSPVWSPARTSMSSARASRMIASADCTARAGPSNVATKPSPVVFTSRPRESAQLAARDVVVRVEQLPPPPVAKPQRKLGRTDNVGKEHRREHAIGRPISEGPGEEFFDEIEIGSFSDVPRPMTGRVWLDYSCTADAGSCLSRRLDRDDRIIWVCDNQGRHRDRFHDRAAICLDASSQDGLCCRRRRGIALEASEQLIDRGLVWRPGADQEPHRGAVTPVLCDIAFEDGERRLGDLWPLIERRSERGDPQHQRRDALRIGGREQRSRAAFL